ncbi:MAG: ABC-2 family transporter protein [Deltaproteobacteria bacterium]|nr:ABC-2 family transporter protein [Deltaproteobacteria bacterium]MBW2067271.1 ABC-2 family transporter protein [Deltaproteobacteria bacterium]
MELSRKLVQIDNARDVNSMWWIHRVRRGVNLYSALLKTYWQVVMEYRGSMIMWMLSNIMPLVMLLVWVSLAKSGPIGHYDSREFVRYYLALLLVRQLITVWVVWDLDREIRLGELSYKLLKPLNPIHYHVAFNLADKIFRLFTLAPAVFCVSFVIPGLRFDMSPLHIFCFTLSLIFAWGIRFLSQYCIGLLSFWITQSLAINEAFYAGLLMLGGVIAPLDLFPHKLALIVRYTPFRYMLSLPVEILLGNVPANKLLFQLLTQFLWLVVFFFSYRLLWKRGLVRYSAVGA